MKYRINTYDKKYVMVDMIEIAKLSDTQEISSKTFRYTYNIYLAWMKLQEENNYQISTCDIALNRNNPLKKYLTQREHIKTEEDQRIYLYEDKEFKTIDLPSKIKVRNRTK